MQFSVIYSVDTPEEVDLLDYAPRRPQTCGTKPRATNSTSTATSKVAGNTVITESGAPC